MPRPLGSTCAVRGKVADETEAARLRAAVDYLVRQVPTLQAKHQTLRRRNFDGQLSPTQACFLAEVAPVWFNLTEALATLTGEVSTLTGRHPHAQGQGSQALCAGSRSASC